MFHSGNVVLAVSAIPNGQEPLAGLCLFGLLLIAIGTGGIKPNVSSFGGDQFLPTQVKEIAAFFSMFYFCINAGSVASMLITPYIMDTTWYTFLPLHDWISPCVSDHQLALVGNASLALSGCPRFS